MRHLLPLLAGAFSACTSGSSAPRRVPEDTGEALPADSGLAPLQADFELGEPQTCESPVSPAWQEASEQLGGAEVWPAGDHYGSLALIEVDGALALLHGEGPDQLVLRRLQDGQELHRMSLPVEAPSAIREVVPGDFDGDGTLDLMVAVEDLWWVPDLLGGGTPQALTAEELGHAWHSILATDLDEDGQPELLGGFVDSTWEPSAHVAELVRMEEGRNMLREDVAGDPNQFGLAFHFSRIDLTGDGLLDVYNCNDLGAEISGNRLLANDGQGGLQLTDAPQLELTLSCMGHSFGDIDADGDLDLLVTALDRNVLLGFDPDLGFFDISAARGLGPFQSDQMGWGSDLVDMDNDGALDLVVATADFERPDQQLFPLSWLRQGSDGRFVEAGPAVGLPQETGARAVLARELNGDGLPDLLVTDTDRSPRLLLSQGCTEDSWLEIAAPDGSEVLVIADGIERRSLIGAHPGYRALGPAVAHVGLGSSAEVDELRLRLPGGEEHVLTGPFAANRLISWTGE